MAPSPDGIPYGTRWGFRTPSPDFARTAVEPLSPPPASTPTFAARASVFSNDYISPTVYPYGSQYPTISRSQRDTDAAPQQPYNHGYLLATAGEKQPPLRESNRLDALAEIALMHGASRLAPSYNPPVPPPPPPPPPVAVVAAASHSVGATTAITSWQRPDSAQPPPLPRPLEVVDTIPIESVGSRASSGREQSFGPIGQGRRGILGGRGSSNVDFVPSRLLTSGSAVPLPVVELVPTTALPSGTIEPLPAVGTLPNQVEGFTHPWINTSPIDEYLSSPASDDHGHSITVVRPEDSVKVVQDQMEDFPEDVDVGKTSLPTPTQDDHIITSSANTSSSIVEREEVTYVNEPIANLTPEIANNESPTKTPEIIDVIGTNFQADLLAHATKDQLMAEVPPQKNGVESNNGNVKNMQMTPDTEEFGSNTAEVANATQPVNTLADDNVSIAIDPLPFHNDHPTGTTAIAVLNDKLDDDALRNRRSSSRISKSSDAKKTGRKLKVKAPSAEPKGVSAIVESVLQPSGEEEDCQTCKIHYSEDDGRNGAWIGCDGCKGWHHARCVKLDQATVNKIDKFYCILCEPTHGKSTLKRSSGRARIAIDYDALHNGSSAPVRNPEDPRIHPYIKKILEENRSFTEDNLRRMRPELVTSTVIDGRDGTAWADPFIVPAKWNPTPWNDDSSVHDSASTTEGLSLGTSIPGPPLSPPNGARRRSGSPIHKSHRPLPGTNEWNEERDDADTLGMRIPSGLTVRRVAEMIGVDTPVPMVDVVTQEPPKETWTMGRLADYFESPVKETIYNCISCEVSNSPLGELISRPKAVRESDLVDRVWKHAQGFSKPTVGKYVLMSVKDSFTDFHVDFGGSSVFYHIYEGKKVFLVIPPTEKALKMYEKWSSSENMNYTFLPDLLPDVPCTLIRLDKGDTFFIPSGWIHAVYTPVDSLVIGGNFLTRNFYVNQMRIYNIEAVTGVPKQMRYPRYTTLMWASMFNYIDQDRMPREIEKDVLTDILGRKNKLKPFKHSPIYSIEELKGLSSLIDFLYRNVMICMGVITTSQRPGGPKIGKAAVDAVRKAVPWPINRNPLLYLKHFARWCIWKRACSDIVPGGEKVPDWAQVNWFPPGIQGRTDGSMEISTQADADSINNDAPRRGGLRDRSKSSVTPDDTLGDFNYFPERLVPIVTGVNGNRRSSSTMPKQGKRKSDVGVPGPSKKIKATRRSRQLSPLLAIGDGKKNTDQYLQLADGSIYVKKLSNLGPPRIGCESCRLKKTGCKHKEEIRARGWCDDDRLTQDVEPKLETEEAPGQEDDDNETVVETPPKSNPIKGLIEANDIGSPAKATALPQESPTVQRQTPTSNQKLANNKVPVANGPPVGYKGRKPSCDDCKILKKKCLHQDTWKLVQDKQAAAEARKALKKYEQSHRRQAKESKRKATVQRQKDSSGEVGSFGVKEATPVVEESIVVRTPAVLATPVTPAAPATPAPLPTPVLKVLLAPKQIARKPYSRRKDHTGAEDFDLGLDTSILEEAPQYTSVGNIATPPIDPSIMAPPMDVFDESPKAPKAGQPRIMPPPPSPVANPTPSQAKVQNELQREYIAALHQRTTTSKPKVTYTSTNKSIKRKSEEESPDQGPSRRTKKDSVPVGVADGQTTFENLRQLSLGLRVRGQRGGEVC